MQSGRKKERSAAKEAAHEQNTETENNRRDDKEKDDNLERQLDFVGDVVPLVHFADQPGDRAEEKSGGAMESRRNCEHRNRCQPKHPPNRMEPSAKIRECSRRETRADDKNRVTSSHPEDAMMWLFFTLLARQEFV
jgi:hypothetical protein